MTVEEIKKLIRDVPDFPKPGMIFRDFTPLIADARGFAAVVDQLARALPRQSGCRARNRVARLHRRRARGVSIGRRFRDCAQARQASIQSVDQAYDLEYGSASLQMHQDALEGVGRVLLVDDLLATGGTAAAALQLVHKIGGNVIGCAFVVELDALKGRERLAPVNCFSLVHYD